MSEKTFWQWLNKKMDGHWEADRIENCSNKGIPDTVLSLVDPRTLKKHTVFAELKDWGVPKKHSLLIEQKNFLETFGGVVLIRTLEKDIIVCHKDFEPLLSADLNWAMANGRVFKRSDFNPVLFYTYLIATQTL